MNYSEAVKQLESSKEFNSWKKTHKDAYLVHFFKMFDKANEKIWQIGYFNPKSNLISVFVVDSKISKNEDSEVFKEQQKMVLPLKLENVSVYEEKALETANKILKENYKSHTIFKSFMILQNIDKIGQVWNVTFVTDQFKTVNVKIDSKTGDCVSHKLISLIGEK